MLSLARIASRVFDADSADAANPALRGFIQDLVAPYRLGLREDTFAAARGHSYGEMAQALADEVLDASVELDLIVLAQAIPDVIPGRSTATYLSDVLPGDALAFAICDQGSTVGFTALRLADACLRPGQHGLVLVVEQSAVHHELPVDPLGRSAVVLPDRHTGVAMVVRGGDGDLRLRPPVQYADVAPDRVPALLGGHLRDGNRVLLGSQLSELTTVDTATVAWTVARTGAPTTGVWSALADVVNAVGTPAGAVTVADYDPALGYLCVLSVND